MSEAVETNAAGAETGGYDYKRLHSYPLIRVRMSKCSNITVYHFILMLFYNNNLLILCYSIQI